jgi:hypothetical protein
MSDSAAKPSRAKKPAVPVSEATNDVLAEPMEMAEPVPEAAAPEAVLVSALAPRRFGWLGPVLGGVVAAGLGFALAQYQPIAQMMGGAVSGASVEEVAALRAEIADMQAAIAAQPAADTSEMAARLDGVETALAALPLPANDSLEMDAMMGRLAALEARPVGGLSGADAAALAALQTEIASIKTGGIAQAQVDAASAELQAKLDEALAAAGSLQQGATEAATKASQRGAVMQIAAALDSGAPFGSAIQALEGVSLPKALTANSAGLPSLKSLQDSFPGAARQALDSALKANMGNSWTERATSFLRTQVGARSLEPREGADPDAVLSRAEAALTAGDVPGALAELDALPDEAKTALQTWRIGADQREAAETALAGVMRELGL